MSSSRQSPRHEARAACEGQCGVCRLFAPLLWPAIKQRENRTTHLARSMADVLTVIDKMIKQRRDSIVQFEAGRRQDLASPTRSGQSRCWRVICPHAAESEIDAMISEAEIASTGASASVNGLRSWRPEAQARAGRADNVRGYRRAIKTKLSVRRPLGLPARAARPRRDGCVALPA